jgi:hypothetical protein
LPQGIQLFDVPFEKPTTILAYGMKAIKRSSFMACIDTVTSAISNTAVDIDKVKRFKVLECLVDKINIVLASHDSMFVVDYRTGNQSFTIRYRIATLPSAIIDMLVNKRSIFCLTEGGKLHSINDLKC